MNDITIVIQRDADWDHSPVHACAIYDKRAIRLWSGELNADAISALRAVVGRGHSYVYEGDRVPSKFSHALIWPDKLDPDDAGWLDDDPDGREHIDDITHEWRA